MKIFGIDPGSERTGYGCIETRGSRHHLVIFGSLSAPARSTFPEKLKHIHGGLSALLATHRPDCVAVETIFYSRNVRSATNTFGFIVLHPRSWPQAVAATW